MKKNNIITILFLLLFSSIATHAQPGFQWGARGGSGASGSGSDEEILAIKTDAAGNVYVLGEIRNSLANVDGVSGISTKDRAALASWDCEGNLRWVKFFGGGGSLGAMEIDTLGGIYLMGSSWSDSFYIDTDTMITGMESSTYRNYLVKYNTAGVLVWVKNTSITSGQLGHYFMDCNQNGDIYLLSNLQPGTYESGAMTITDTSIQILKYNKDGVFLSHHPMDIHFEGGTSNKYSLLFNANFTRDHNNGRYYLAGYTVPMPSGSYGDMYFGEDFMLPGTGTDFRAYLSAWDAEGNYLWATQSPTNPGAIEDAPKVDDEGNIYIGGNFVNGYTFNGYTIENTSSSMAPMLMKVNMDGEVVWATNATTTAGAVDVSTTLSNNIIALSDVQFGRQIWDGDTIPNLPSVRQISLVRFNTQTGKLVCNQDYLITTGTKGSPNRLASNDKGYIYLGGFMSGSAYVGPDTLHNIGGNTDWFVARYGAPDCDCSLPNASFSYTATGTNAYSFTYTGSTPVDSVRWEFGDGTIVSGLTASHTYSTPPPYTPSIVVYNSCGIVVDYRHITGSTGIDGTEWTSTVLIYPNPTKDYFTVEGAGIGTEAVMYNTLGQAVITKRISALKESINVTSLPAGVYVIHFTTTEGNKGSVKVLVEK